MNTRRSRRFVLLFVLVFICMGIFVFAYQARFFHRLYDNHILDNWNHYLPCNELPGEIKVREVLEQHPETIQAIEQVNPGMVGVEVDTFSCPTQADLVIWYATHQDRLAIERIIGGKTFFGVPIRLQNR